MSMLDEARSLLDSSEPQQCIDLLLSTSIDSSQELSIFQLLGEAYLDLGDPQNAYQQFTKAAKLDPQGVVGGIEKFLWLGQITGGQDGLKWFEKGAMGLREEMSKHGSNLNSLSKKKLIESLCSMIEIWMTDLCMEPEAESSCEKLITEALMVDDALAEPWSVLGSIRISQQRNDDAKEALRRSWEIFEMDSELGIDDVPSLTRLAQNMTEMDMLELVLDVTKRIQTIDDQVVEAYYLNGFSHFQLYKRLSERNSDSRKIARHAAGARDAFTLIYELIPQGEDEEMDANVKEMIGALPEVSADDYTDSSDEELIDEEVDFSDDD